MMGRQQAIMQERHRIELRITQFRETTQGLSSVQESHPSGQAIHSNIPTMSYWLGRP